jgi:hypothetical protein
MTEEIWKDVVGYEGRYQVSSHAKVRSLARTKMTKRGFQRWNGKDLKPFLDNNGYYYVNLCDGTKAKKTALHVVVLTAFKGVKPTGMIALHNDGNASNCLPGNLRWGTYKDNAADAKRHGTFAMGVISGGAKLTEQDVTVIRKSALPSRQLAEVYGVKSTTIRAVKSFQNWRHIQ